MTSPLAFVSFAVSKDEHSRDEFMKQLAASSTPFAVEDWSLDPLRPVEDWHKRIRGKIGRCNMVIVLLGPDTATSENVRLEMQMAQKANVPFFGVYLSGTNGVSLPAGMARDRAVAWDWPGIGSAVTQLMKEGKNHIFA